MGGGLADKVAIVTGGNSGIGEATVHRLAREGAAVAILARREAEGRAVEGAVREAGGEAVFFGCDVTERVSVEAAVAAVAERYGAVHVLFNNAGGGGRPHSFDAPGEEAFEEGLRLNLTSTYLVTQVCWPHLVAAGGASVVNMSSTAAVVAFSEAQRALVPGMPPPGYWAAKAGTEALTRYIASVGSPHGIRANCVRPGQIVSPMTTRFSPGHHFLEPLFDAVQLTHGAGYPEDVANVVYFLASEESRFVNGQILDIDGGAVLKV